MELKWSRLRDETHEVVFCLADDIFYMLVDEIFADLCDIKNGLRPAFRSVTASSSRARARPFQVALNRSLPIKLTRKTAASVQGPSLSLTSN